MVAHKMKAELSTIPTPDLGAVATAFGGRGRLARSIDEVRAAAAEWVAKPGPMIIDVRISRGVLNLSYRRRLYARKEKIPFGRPEGPRPPTSFFFCCVLGLRKIKRNGAGGGRILVFFSNRSGLIPCRTKKNSGGRWSFSHFFKRGGFFWDCCVEHALFSLIFDVFY